MQVYNFINRIRWYRDTKHRGNPARESQYLFYVPADGRWVSVSAENLPSAYRFAKQRFGRITRFQFQYWAVPVASLEMEKAH